MKISLDLDRCQGHGRCYDLAPEVFGADDEGYVVLLFEDRTVPDGQEDGARAAAANCPEQAIALA